MGNISLRQNDARFAAKVEVLYRPEKVQKNERRTTSWTTTKIASEGVLEFDPKQTYAVCVGAGTYLHYPDKRDSNCADADSEAMSTVMQEKFRVNPDNISLLTGKGQNSTRQNIITSLRDSASKVGRDGILMFSYSGHGIQLENKQLALTPFDFRLAHKADTSIVFVDFYHIILNNCKAKYFVIVLDCCYAGQLMNQLTKHVARMDCSPWYIASSCSDIQKSVFNGRLKHGFFSYFFIDTLKQCDASAGLPIIAALDSCNRFCPALCDLMRPASIDADQIAELCFACPEQTDAEPFKEELSSRFHLEHSGGWLLNYLSSGKLWGMPTDICDTWLDNDASPALKKLRDFLARPEMTGCVYALMSQSMIAMLFGHFSVTNQDLVCDADVCIFCLVGIAGAVAAVEPKVIMTPQCANDAIIIYIWKVLALTELTLMDPKLDALLNMLTLIRNDHGLKNATVPNEAGDQMDATEATGRTDRDAIMEEVASIKLAYDWP